MENSSDATPEIGAVTRLARIAGSLAGVHLEFARHEAAKDGRRLAGGVASLAIGGALLLMTALLLQVAGVLLVHDFGGLAWRWAVLAVAGGDLFLGGVLFAVGSSMVKAPVLPFTRVMVRKTLAAMTQP